MQSTLGGKSILQAADIEHLVFLKVALQLLIEDLHYFFMGGVKSSQYAVKMLCGGNCSYGFRGSGSSRIPAMCRSTARGRTKVLKSYRGKYGSLFPAICVFFHLYNPSFLTIASRVPGVYADLPVF